MSVLDINSSPTQLSSGNKRLSKAPIIILLIIAAVVMYGIFYAALARKQANERQAAEDKEQTIAKNQDVGSFISDLENIKKPTPQILDEETPSTPQLTGMAPNTQNQSSVQHNQNIPQLQQANNTDQDREFQLKRDLQFKALTSVSKLGIRDEPKDKPQTSNNNQSSDTEGMSDYIKAIASLGQPQLAPADMEDKDAKAETFLAKRKNEGYLEHIKQKQISTYEIKAGWVMPAILITGINSDLPRQILAQISQNIYDTATGKYLLIPQGTKVVGAYSSNIIYGQKRILVAWNKLIFPNGDTLNIENMQGTSPDGYSGFTDQVDNHYFRIFGSAFLMSAITAGISIADKSDDAGKETAADKAISAAVQQMGQVAAEMIRKNMNISPTLEIRPGYKFNIFVTKDMILEPLRIDR